MCPRIHSAKIESNQRLSSIGLMLKLQETKKYFDPIKNFCRLIFGYYFRSKSFEIRICCSSMLNLKFDLVKLKFSYSILLVQLCIDLNFTLKNDLNLKR